MLFSVPSVAGFDLMEYFKVENILGSRFDEGQSSYVRLGTMPIVQQTEDVFPQGLPDEYAFVTTFKFRKTSRREDWYLWQIFDKYGIPQVSIRLDGENKAVEYNAVGLTKDAVRAVFKNEEVDNLFDRNWHKIALSVEAKAVSLYLDCKFIQTLPIGDREDIDIHGKTVIGKRLYDSVPIDFDLQRMIIYCDSKHAELETCCDLPTGPCPKKVVTEAPPIEIPTPTPAGVEQQRGPQAVNCSCPAGERGEIGVPGVAGPKGDKGDTGALGAAGPTGLKGAKGETGKVITVKGDRGEKSRGGSLRWPECRLESKATLLASMVEMHLKLCYGFDSCTCSECAVISTCRQHVGSGIQGDSGLPGLSGPRGVGVSRSYKSLDGEKGLKGDKGSAGLQGDKGIDGFPGKPGVPGKEGLGGLTGAPGAAGLKGEKGATGQLGLPGEPGEFGQRVRVLYLL
ncbi:unnamed protein product [Oncorhynchus mykiss]|uniref:Thrombospondin-like N-terminal domain-containing protein n=1 Tax=Oncorhynchus mykiss TaxID=8022 RepID=A0A060XDX9_ONCMY|nr:unnamed protein product [Oncorhynchus mykiss]